MANSLPSRLSSKRTFALAAFLPLRLCDPNPPTVPSGPVETTPVEAGLILVPANGAVGVDWAVPNDVVTVRVLWSTNSSVPSQSPVIENAQPGYVQPGLVNGQTVYFRLEGFGVTGQMVFTDTAHAKPGGAFDLVSLGDGELQRLREPGFDKLGLQNRIHVVLLAEGYIASDLDVFDDDVETWMNSVFGVPTFANFSNLFVIWKSRIASAQRVEETSPQSANTAFLVPLLANNGGVSGDIPLTGETSGRVWDHLEDFSFPPASFYGSGGRPSKMAKNLVVHLLIYKPSSGGSGFSGRARALENPNNSSQRIYAALGHGLSHEFSHALSRVTDEYLVSPGGSAGPNPEVNDSHDISNVVNGNQCGDLPWQHLMAGGSINPNLDQLVGAFGSTANGYHSEFKCLMNGGHENELWYGGNGNLRVNRLCNFCREITAFRIYERVGVLDDMGGSWQTWQDDYREPFFDTFGFDAPAPLPQENNLGDPWFQSCAD